MSTILALDIGTTATKGGLVVDGRLTVVVEHRHRSPATEGGHGWVEQDPRHWLASAIACVRDLGTPDPDAIAVTGQMQNLILVDGDGEPLCDAILYSDVRAADEHQVAVRELGSVWESAIGYGPDATTLPAKYLWLSRHRQELCGRAVHTLFGAHSFVVGQLCGVAAVDPTTAATTGLMAVEQRTWWEPAVEFVSGCVGGALPALVSPSEPVGGISVAAAEATGLAVGTPVIHGSGDAGAVTTGAVGQTAGTPYVYVGTSGWAGELTNTFAPRSGSILLPASAPDQWLRAAPLMAAGGAIEWACRVLLGDLPIDRLDELVGESCAAAEGLLFVPTLGGDRTSGELDATGSLLGARWSTSRSLVAAAVVEGVAHELLRSLEAVSVTKFGPLMATGGGLRLRALAQAIADVTGREVYRSASVHATLTGVAATATGVAGKAAAHPEAERLAPRARYRSDHDLAIDRRTT